jgi:hypothetical protein
VLRKIDNFQKYILPADWPDYHHGLQQGYYPWRDPCGQYFYCGRLAHVRPVSG